MEHGPPPVPSPDHEPRPPLGSWPRIYALVIAVLGLVILFCGWLTRAGR